MSSLRPLRSATRWLGSGLILALSLAPGAVQGQMGGDCDVPNHNGAVTLSLSNGTRITYFSSPTIVCSGNTRISADSAVFYQATDYIQFFRHVVFQDGDRRLTADQAHYFDQEKRLRAWGQVILNDRAEGSIIRGDTMVLLRAGPGRLQDQLTVLGMRPHATLYPTLQPVKADSAAGPEVSPDANEVPPPDSARGARGLMAPDSVSIAIPDTAAGAPPDSAGAILPDTAAVAPPDSAAAVLPDTAAVAPPDTVRAAPPLNPGDTATSRTPPRAATPPTREERTPYEIKARRMFLEGTRYFRAVGSVTIDRDSVSAVADSVEYDEGLGALFLANDARLTTGGFDLSAASIRLDIPQDDIRSVLAREDALLEGQDLWLLAPTISLLLTEGKVERLIAVQAPPEDSVSQPERRRPRQVPDEVREMMGLDRFPARPHAFAQDFLLWADSIEVLAPDEVLDEVWAMGKAHGESLSRDSLNSPGTGPRFQPDSLEAVEANPLFQRDWLEGDTIVAIFVPREESTGAEELGPEVAVTRPPSAGAEGQEEVKPDSAGFRLDRLVAMVGARSLYRMAPTDSTLTEGEDHRLAIHYVIGDEITIVMKGGEVDRMEVAGNTRGIHLEPAAIRRRMIPPDTTVAPPGGNPGGRL